jgi:protein SCO1/2
MSGNKRLNLQITVGLLAAALLLAAAFRLRTPAYTYQGSLINPPALAPDFELDSNLGTPFRLSEQRGKFVLLYFGYTFCPDVCPTTLYDLSMLTQSLEEQAGDIQVAMVTVDPQRDTLDNLGSYVTTFDPTFLGLSGDPAKLEAVWQAYGVYRAENQVEGAAGYLVDHTARVYVIDPQGELRLTFPFGISWQAMAADLEHLMGE